METTEEFTGLGMPVFTAFGWAGEETALKYALSQLELFITTLHANLPGTLKNELPEFGLSEEGQGVYLAADSNVESNVHVAFYARPMSLEVQLTLTNKEVLSKGLKQMEKDPAGFLRLLTRLGPGWSLHIQQMHINEETGERGHYQDLVKEEVAALDDEQITEIVEKASYLNGEDKWVTPIYISQRVPSQQAAAMEEAIIEVMTERLMLLTPLIMMLSGRNPRKKISSSREAPKSKQKQRVQRAPKAAPVTPADGQTIKNADTMESFSYVAELKPLHVRRGFVNLTPAHWPFFAINARTETRPVTVVTATMRDKNSSVWRLQPNDLARLVLSPRAHEWLENNFSASDRILLTASKVADDEIEIILEPAD